MKTKVTQIMVAVRHMGALTDREADDLVREGIRQTLVGHDWATGVVNAAPRQGETDVAGTIYDGETAIHFAHELTGVDPDICAKVFFSRDRFHLGVGVVSDDIEIYETTAKELREKYPAFFKPRHIKERYVDSNLEQAFVVADSGLDPSVVEAVLDADLEYMRRLGLLA